MMYIAHKREDGKIQTVAEHLTHVAELSSKYAISEMKELCYASGILHDAGKYLNDFQRRINGDLSIHVEHAIVGAQILKEKYKCTPELLLMETIIAGHHSGIPDLGFPSDTADDSSLSGRLQRSIADYSAFFSENDISNIALNPQIFNNFLMQGCRQNNPDDLIEKYAFLTRYAFSCLTDADSIDTAEFNSGEKRECLHADFTSCLRKIDERFSRFVPQTDLQKARSKIQSQVYEKAT